MSSFFDPKSPYRRMLAATDQKGLVSNWFDLQAQRIQKSPGLFAAGEPGCLVVGDASLERLSREQTAKKFEPVITLDDGNTARVSVSNLPADARCLVLIIDKVVRDEIRKYLAPPGTGEQDTELIKRLLAADGGNFNFHRTRIQSGVPTLEGQADRTGYLRILVPVRPGADWTEEDLVVVIYQE